MVLDQAPAEVPVAAAVAVAEAPVEEAPVVEAPAEEAPVSSYLGVALFTHEIFVRDSTPMDGKQEDFDAIMKVFAPLIKLLDKNLKSNKTAVEEYRKQYGRSGYLELASGIESIISLDFNIRQVSRKYYEFNILESARAVLDDTLIPKINDLICKSYAEKNSLSEASLKKQLSLLKKQLSVYSKLADSLKQQIPFYMKYLRLTGKFFPLVVGSAEELARHHTQIHAHPPADLKEKPINRETNNHVHPMEQFDAIQNILKRNDPSFDMSESNRLSVLYVTRIINYVTRNKAEKAKELSLLQAAKVEVDRLMPDITQQTTAAFNAKEASRKSWVSTKSRTADLTKPWENLKMQQDKLKKLEYSLNQQIPIYEESMKGGRRRRRTRKPSRGRTHTSSRGRTHTSSRGRTHTSSRRRPKRTVHQ